MKNSFYFRLRYYLFTFLMLGFEIANAQTEDFNWMKGAGGDMWDGCKSVAVDNKNNAYIIGDFGSTANFGNLILTSKNYDMFLVKYAENDGSVIWARQATGYTNIYGISNAIDQNNNVYVCGIFIDTLYIGDTIIAGNAGVHSVFLAKYDENGQFIWARGAISDQEARPYRIAINSKNEIYLEGEFMKNVRFLPDTSLFGYPFQHSVFIAKFDENGNLIRAKMYSGNDCFHARQIYIDKSDNVYISGHVVIQANLGGIYINQTNGYYYWDTLKIWGEGISLAEKTSHGNFPIRVFFTRKAIRTF